MRKYVLVIFLGLIGSLLINSCAQKETKTTTLGNLQVELLPNNHVVVSNPFLQAEIAPELGGRIVSLVNKQTGEEMLEKTEAKIGGGFYDILDLAWPGTAEKPYSLNYWGINKEKRKAYVILEYTVGSESEYARGVNIVKVYSFDENNPVVFSEVRLRNYTGDDKKIIYWHQTRPILGDTNNLEKTQWIPQYDEITSLEFQSGSGGHGDMYLTGSFVGLTGKLSATSLVWVFPTNITYMFWSWHDVKVPTFDILFKPVILKPGEQAVYNLNLALLPSLPGISYADYNTGIAAHTIVNLDKTKNQIKINLYLTSFYNPSPHKEIYVDIIAYKNEDKEKFITITTNNKLDVEFYKISQNQYISQLPKEFSQGYLTIETRLKDYEGDIIGVIRNVEKIGDIAIPDYKNLLRIVFLWTLHQPLYLEAKLSRANISRFLNIYKTIVDVYSKLDTPVTINITGSLLYQLIKYFPSLVNDFKQLAKQKKIEIVASGFSHPLLPFLTIPEIYQQVKLDRELKINFLEVEPTGIHLPEMAFDPKLMQPLADNNIKWLFLPDLAVQEGYKNIPIDYFFTYRLLSTGPVLYTAIMDSKSMRTIIRKNERAIDEFIQRLIEIEKDNTEGNKVVVIVNNGEFIGDGQFIVQLVNKLKNIKWIKIVSGSQLFAELKPVRDLLADRIKGNWYLDPEKGTYSYRLWFDTSLKKKIWDMTTGVATNLLAIRDKFEQAQEVGVDVSYAEILLERAWENMIVARASDWVWEGTEKAYKIVEEKVKNVKVLTAQIFEALIDAFNNKPPKVPKFEEMPDTSPVTNYEEMTKNLSDKIFNVFIVKTVPEIPKITSCVEVKAKIMNYEEGINYDAVYLIYETKGKILKKKMELGFDGWVYAILGRGDADQEVEARIYAKTLKGKEGLTKPFTIKVFSK